MNLAEDQELRSNVEKNCDSHKVANGGKAPAYQVLPMFIVEKQGPNVGRETQLFVFYSITGTQNNRDERLKQETQPAGSRKTGQHVLEELLPEKVQVSRLYQPSYGCRCCDKDKNYHERSEDRAASNRGHFLSASSRRTWTCLL